MKYLFNVDLICITILIYELFCLFSNKKNIRLFIMFYGNLYLTCILIEIFGLILNLDVFYWFIGFPDDFEKFIFLNPILLLITLFTFIYNKIIIHKKINYYFFTCVCFFIFSFIFALNIHVFSDYFLNLRVLLYFVSVVFLGFIIIIRLRLPVKKILLKMNILSIISVFFYIATLGLILMFILLFYCLIIMRTRLTFLMVSDTCMCFFFIITVMLPTIFYFLFRSNNYKLYIMLFFIFIFLLFIFLYFYYLFCVSNFEPFLINFQFFSVRINYTIEEQFNFLSDLWETMEPYYKESGFKKKINVIIKIFSQKKGIDLDMLQSDFRVAVHVAYKSYLCTIYGYPYKNN